MEPELPISAFEIFATGVDHSECVAFDRSGELWAGGEAGQIYRVNSERKPQLIANLGSFCAGLAFSPQDELFVCNPLLGIVQVKRSGEFSIFATHAGDHKLVCPNFGVFDSRGNYYVTDSGQWKKNNGYLIRYTPDGHGTVLAGPMGYTNGLALSADETCLFMVESNTDSVFHFEISSDGSVGAPKLFAEHCGRFPDGLALDAEGNLFVSCYASDEIWRVDGLGNKSLFAWDRWGILLGSPTNMAFGGANMDEMYVANLSCTTLTRARVGRKGQPLANRK